METELTLEQLAAEYPNRLLVCKIWHDDKQGYLFNTAAYNPRSALQFVWAVEKCEPSTPGLKEWTLRPGRDSMTPFHWGKKITPVVVDFADSIIEWDKVKEMPPDDEDEAIYHKRADTIEDEEDTFDGFEALANVRRECGNDSTFLRLLARYLQLNQMNNLPAHALSRDVDDVADALLKIVGA